MATDFTTPTSRFLALQTRNPLASHAFIYSVTTTKIYCRPTCSSRLARRANIKFHNTAAEAAADGFRACKRCRPDDVEGLDQQVEMVKRVCAMIDREEEKLSVKSLAKRVGLTESHFCRVFKKVEGLTVGEYRGLVRERKEGSQLVVGSASEVDGKRVASFPVLSPEENEAWNGDYHDPSFATNDFLLPWDSADISGVLDGSIDCDFASIQVDFGTVPFDFTPTEFRREEECFEFLDFGSPPRVALFV